MSEDIETSRKYILIGILIIALGITFTTTLKDTVGTLGTVLIAVGGLFFIIGMSKKRKEDERSNE
jgi:Sec-independent protein secretion pathway component TatC